VCKPFRFNLCSTQQPRRDGCTAPRLRVNIWQCSMRDRREGQRTCPVPSLHAVDQTGNPGTICITSKRSSHSGFARETKIDLPLAAAVANEVAAQRRALQPLVRLIPDKPRDALLAGVVRGPGPACASVPAAQDPEWHPCRAPPPARLQECMSSHRSSASATSNGGRCNACVTEMGPLLQAVTTYCRRPCSYCRSAKSTANDVAAPKSPRAGGCVLALVLIATTTS
jgi:hypothetical protein